MLAIREKFFPSVLHVGEKLSYGFAPRRVAAGTMPSSSSAMCIWPVGLVDAGDPRAAADQAYALAALIHVGDVDSARTEPRWRGLARPTGTTSSATHTTPRPATDRMRFARDGSCRIRPATLARGDLRRGVEFAANFGRDTDTIPSMTGALCGAVGGPDAIPAAWTTALGATALAEAEALALRLAELARAKVAERERLSRTVPALARSSPAPIRGPPCSPRGSPCARALRPGRA